MKFAFILTIVPECRLDPHFFVLPRDVFVLLSVGWLKIETCLILFGGFRECRYWYLNSWMGFSMALMEQWMIFFVGTSYDFGNLQPQPFMSLKHIEYLADEQAGQSSLLSKIPKSE